MNALQKACLSKKLRRKLSKIDRKLAKIKFSRTREGYYSRCLAGSRRPGCRLIASVSFSKLAIAMTPVKFRPSFNWVVVEFLANSKSYDCGKNACLDFPRHATFKFPTASML